jgi:phosphoglycolate phosphatase
LVTLLSIKMSKINTIIFDFDGTIADTFDFISIEFNKISKRLGENKLTLYEINRLHNDTFENLIGKYPLWKILLIAFLLQNRMSKNISSVKIHSGIKELILDLYSQGYHLAIFSNNTPSIIHKFLAFHGLENCFEQVVGRRNLSSKSKAMSKFINKYKLDPDKTIYIGDEVKDILAAKDNGIKIMSVVWGFNSSRKLREYEPDWLIYKASRISKIISRL